MLRSHPLYRLRSFSAAVLTIAIVAGIVATPGVARAQPSVSCSLDEIGLRVGGGAICVAYVGDVVRASGEPLRMSPGSSGGGSGRSCVRVWGDNYDEGWAGPKVVPCHNASLGWFSRTWDCYFRPVLDEIAIDVDQEQPPPGYDPDNPPGGGYYWASCFPPAGNEYGVGPHWLPGPDGGLWAGSSLVVLAAAPEGVGGFASRLGELWVEAVNGLGLLGPAITTAPPLSTGGLVGLRTWLWTERSSPNVWGVLTATADARPEGLNEWVDVRAEPITIVWDLGEPDRAPVTCDHPGEEYRQGMQRHSPDCGFTYHQPSRTMPDGTYPVTAITTWRVQWWVNGAWDGQLDLQVGSTAPYRVDEVQVLVGRGE
jgi:hypothetical protein